MTALKNARLALTSGLTHQAEVWALLALILTAQQEGKLAVAVTEAGMAATPPREHHLLLRIKAQLLQCQGLPYETAASIVLTCYLYSSKTVHVCIPHGYTFLWLAMDA